MKDDLSSCWLFWTGLVVKNPSKHEKLSFTKVGNFLRLIIRLLTTSLTLTFLLIFATILLNTLQDHGLFSGALGCNVTTTKTFKAFNITGASVCVDVSSLGFSFSFSFKLLEGPSFTCLPSLLKSFLA